jgi:hypothetical protein
MLLKKRGGRPGTCNLLSRRLEDTEIMKLWDEDRKNKNIDEIVFVTGGGNENLSALVSAYENFSGFAIIVLKKRMLHSSSKKQ